jgi:putative ABC transport system ATP-binding protein
MSGRHRRPDDGDDVVFDIEFDAPEPRRARAAVVSSDAMAPSSIEARDIGYRRAGRTILDGVSMTVFPGRSVAVMGPSGSGKTSLLTLLAGLEQPDSGSVTRDRAGRTGLILQSYGLVGVLTAAENVEAPLQAGALGRLTKTQIRDRSTDALAIVGLEEVADHLIEELSGGQQQRVAIARALAVDPTVLFADELTAELDHDWKTRIISIVLDVARRGGIVVLATHDRELAERCDHVVRLDDGRLTAAG